VIFSNGLCKVFVPSAFTPNGDGTNDVFKVLGTGLITSLQLKIFNRYGQVVFETTEKNRGWDGKLKGTPSPGGGFVYLLTYKDINSTDVKVMRGSFILIR
jgi:gliding motility-associated-like protein